ncbi:IS3 family transposase [Palleronia caenipelagi]|uniref:IS3 family transposase n=2 Tax=Palleronia caenipelagi TaxID=2489174 RepID=A0A547Q9B9_9RHOB|nr:IS3 family transposase [Palleronia caenipelagi]
MSAVTRAGVRHGPQTNGGRMGGPGGGQGYGHARNRRLVHGRSPAGRAVLRRAPDGPEPAQAGPRPVPVLDRGVQYASGDSRKIIHRAKLTQCMSRKGERLDNAQMETFFTSLKKELVHRQRFITRALPKAANFEYTEAFYNRQRTTPPSTNKRRPRRSKKFDGKWPRRINNQTDRKPGRRSALAAAPAGTFSFAATRAVGHVRQRRDCA